jgi:hypothetical protein
VPGGAIAFVRLGADDGDAAIIYGMPPSDGPLNTVIHVTRPGQNPVTSQPFDLVMTRTADGISIVRQTAPLCPETANASY